MSCEPRYYQNSCGCMERSSCCAPCCWWVCWFIFFIILFPIGISLVSEANSMDNKTTCSVYDVQLDTCVYEEDCGDDCTNYYDGERYQYYYYMECGDDADATFRDNGKCRGSASQKYVVGDERECWTNNGCTKKARFSDPKNQEASGWSCFALGVLFFILFVQFFWAWNYGRKRNAFNNACC